MTTNFCTTPTESASQEFPYRAVYAPGEVHLTIKGYHAISGTYEAVDDKGNRYAFPIAAVTKMRRPRPLPIAVGSVIEFDGSAYIRMNSHNWYCPTKPGVHVVSDGYLEDREWWAVFRPADSLRSRR